jgi:hypothetical protein
VCGGLRERRYRHRGYGRDGKGGTATVKITVVVGTDKKETLNGTGDADMIFGRNGDDTTNAGNNNDLVCGGNDTATDYTPSQGDTKDATIP